MCQVAAWLNKCCLLRPRNLFQLTKCRTVLLPAYRSLAKLHTLKIDGNFVPLAEIPGSLSALQQLSQVQRLTLRYTSAAAAHTDCTSWARLPGLADITIDGDGDCEFVRVDGETLTALGAALRQCTSLKSLHMQFTLEEEDPADGTVSLCHDLSALTNLKNLNLTRFGFGELAQRDCVHLSSLCALTRLELQCFYSAVGDAVAVALVSRMPELRHLDLELCDLQTDALLPLLAQLPHLTRVELQDNPGFEASLPAIKQFNEAASSGSSGGCKLWPPF